MSSERATHDSFSINVESIQNNLLIDHGDLGDLYIISWVVIGNHAISYPLRMNGS